MQEDQEEAVTRVLRGGATAFPKETPRPPALPFLPILRNFIVETIRGPMIAAVLIKLTYPTFIRVVKRMHGTNERGIFVTTMTIVHVLLYANMFAFFELFGKTRWLRQYKLARTPAQEPTWAMKSRVLKDFVIGTVVNYVAVLPIGHYLFTRFGGMPSVYSKLPSLWKVYLHIVCSLHCSQFLFAIAHRILHHGPLYRAIHKKHHEFVGWVIFLLFSQPENTLTHTFSFQYDYNCGGKLTSSGKPLCQCDSHRHWRVFVGIAPLCVFRVDCLEIGANPRVTQWLLFPWILVA